MSTRHTPKEWRVVTCTGHTGQDGVQRATIACGEGRHLIHISQNVLGKTFDELTANAHLMAAAPDLLEACKEVLHDLEVYQTEDARHLTVERVSELFAALRAAITKAEEYKP